MIEQRVTLRYGAQQIPAIVQAVQGDTGRDVIFELADYEIPAGATANYYIDKPDGNAVYNSAEVLSSTEILAHLTEQALAAPGRNNGQVRILSDGEVITSFDFVLEVEVFRGIMRMQSETEINIFDQAIEDAVNTATEEAVAEIQAQTPVVTGMQNSIAPSYSSSSTYAVGDYVMYNAQLYRCITAITTAEAWTAAHWLQVPLSKDVNGMKDALNIYNGIVNLVSGQTTRFANYEANTKRMTTGVIHAFAPFTVTINTGYRMVAMVGNATPYTDKGWVILGGGSAHFDITEGSSFVFNVARSDLSDFDETDNVGFTLVFDDSNYSDIKPVVDGLVTDVNNIKNAIDINAITYTENYLINTTPNIGETVDLTPVYNAAFQYAIIDVTGIKNVTLNGTGWTTGVLWAFIDSNNKLISKSAGNAVGSNLLVDVPLNAAKMISNMWKSTAGTSYTGELLPHSVERIDANQKQINELRKDFDGNILYDQIANINTVIVTVGVTVTTNGDGSITINGTSTAAGVATIGIIPVIKANTWYEADGCPDIADIDETCWMYIDGFGAVARNFKKVRSTQATNCAVQIRFASGKTFTNVVFRPYFAEIGFSSAKMNIIQLAKNQIRSMFDNSVNISGIESKIAVTDGFDIDPDGNLYVGAVLGTGASEYDPNVWTAHLIKANIGDIEQTKNNITAFENGETSQTIDNYAMRDYQWCGAKKISDHEIIVYCSASWDKAGETTWFNGYVAKVYDLTAETFGEVQTMTITVNEDTYPLYIKYDYGSGISNESLAEVEAIWSATGIEHGPWYGQEMRYIYYIQINPVKYDGYWWAPLCLGGQSHALCKSSDMIHWTYVCDIPLGQSSEEVAICFYDGFIYATSRGNPSIDSQYSKIMRCSVDSLTTASWDTPVSLSPCRGERPAIVAINGYIYVLQCLENDDVDGLLIPRSHRRAFVFDTELNIVNQIDVDFTYPILHPTYYKHGGNVFTVLSSDKRCYIDIGGDGRSELSFAHLDMNPFKTGMTG